MYISAKSSPNIVFSAISSFLKYHDSVSILITGMTCSGKTTLSNTIMQYFSEAIPVSIISQDSYFKNLEEISPTEHGYNMESVSAFHISEFVSDVNQLIKSGQTIIPTYDVSINKRIFKNTIINKGRINIFEGLHTISLLKDIPDTIKIFINTSPEICLNRRLHRDTEKYRIPENIIRQKWQYSILPESKKSILCQMDYADILY